MSHFDVASIGGVVVHVIDGFGVVDGCISGAESLTRLKLLSMIHTDPNTTFIFRMSYTMSSNLVSSSSIGKSNSLL